MKNRIKLLSLLLALALCLSLLPVSALAAGTKSTVLGSGKCGDNVTWKLTDDGVMTISGSGPMYNYDMMGLDGDDNDEDTYVPWSSFYENNKCYIVKSVIIEDGVTTIGRSAFHNFRKLTKVTIGKDVTEICGGAFADCRALTSITIPDNVTAIGGAFFGCTALKTIQLSRNLTKIGDFAFNGCKALTKLTIPAGNGAELKIGEYAIAGCESLEEIAIYGNVREIPFVAMASNPSLKRIKLSAVEKFHLSAVSDCPALTEIYYPGTEAVWKKALTGIEYGYSEPKNVKIRPYHRYNYLSNCSAKLQYESYGYTGKAVKPKVTEVRTCAGTKLTEGTHYTVSYENNKDYGTGTVIITGIGKYRGTLRKDFQIVPAMVKNLKASKVVKTGDRRYDITLTWTPNPLATRYEITVYGYVKGETASNTFTLKNIARYNDSIGVRSIAVETDPETGEEITYIGNRKIIRVIME